MSYVQRVEQSTGPSAPAAGQTLQWNSNDNPPREMLTDDAGAHYVLGGLSNASVAAVSGGYASDTYLAGSGLTVLAGQWKAGTTYYCLFDMTKTGAGTAAFTVNIRMGTLGAIGDASVLQLAFAVGTGVIDSGSFELFVNFRSVGSGTAAVIAAKIKCSHHLAATGLITTGASGFGQILGTSAGFNSTTQTKIGISVNGGASFLGTNTIVQSQLLNI